MSDLSSQKQVNREDTVLSLRSYFRTPFVFIWVVCLIPVIILWSIFWKPAPGSSSGLFFFFYPFVLLIPNMVVGLVVGFVHGYTGTRGMRTILFMGFLQVLTVVVATALTPEGSMGDFFVFLALTFVFSLILPLPVILIELGIPYTVGNWFGKRYSSRSVLKLSQE